MGSPLRSPPLRPTRRTTNSEATLISATVATLSRIGKIIERGHWSLPSCSAVAAANSAITSAAGTQAGAFRLKDGAPLWPSGLQRAGLLRCGWRGGRERRGRQPDAAARRANQGAEKQNPAHGSIMSAGLETKCKHRAGLVPGPSIVKVIDIVRSVREHDQQQPYEAFLCPTSTVLSQEVVHRIASVSLGHST